MNINEIKAKRAEHRAAAEKLSNASLTTGIDLAGADLEQYNNHFAEMQRFDAMVTRHNELARFSVDEPAAAIVRPAPGQAEDARVRAEVLRGFEAYVRRGDHSIMAALNITTPASGGYVVPQEWDTTIVERLQDMNVMRQLATIITTQSDRNITVENNLGAAGWTAEGATATNAAGTDDNSFSRVQLTSHKLTRILKVSEELLLDAFFDLMGYLARKYGESFGISEEAAFVGGTGTGQPTGVLAGASAGIVAASATAIASDELLGLYHSLKPAYRRNGSWLLKDSTALLLRKIKDSEGRYVWQPGLTAGQPDMLLGKPVYVSDAMPVAAASAKSILFGDFSYYTIADRAPRTFTRLNELYAENGLVGFRGVERTDGILTLPEAIVSLAQASA